MPVRTNATLICDPSGESDSTSDGKPTVTTEISAVSTASIVLAPLNRSTRSERSSLVPHALQRLAAGLIGSQQIGHVADFGSLEEVFWVGIGISSPV